MEASKQEKIRQFDVNGVGLANGQIFGLPFGFEESRLILLPVPWDVTVSYHDGTSKAPSAILEASPQIDLYDPDHPTGWQEGIYMMEISSSLQQQNHHFRPKANELIRLQEKGQNVEGEQALKAINQACDDLRKWVYEQTHKLVGHDKLVGVIGGEHSVALGFLETLSQQQDTFGILQIDAHADLRSSYEGFTWSHATIMHHAFQLSAVSRIVPVGIRDYCPMEVDFIREHANRITPYYDQDLRNRQAGGQTWQAICEDIVSQLPENVYISFDIDGLDPKLCPATGTPVPGGLDWHEVMLLLQMVVSSGRRIIGFDLSEVCPGKDDWDANVGARVLYKLCNLMLKSNP